MYWYFTVDYFEGIKIFGPFKDEHEARSRLLEMQDKAGWMGFTEVFSSPESNPDLAFKQWFKESIWGEADENKGS